MDINFKSALFASICEIVIVHPIDVFKIHYQQNSNFKFKTFMNYNFNTKYRGFISRSMGILPMRTTFWVSQDLANKNISLNNSILNYITKSTFVSFAQTLIDCPIENMKIGKINNKKIKFNFKFFYKGFSPNLIRNNIFAFNVIGFNKLGDEYDCNKFISGSIGGLLGSIISQPFDYIKTLRQSDKNIKFYDIFNIKHKKYFMNGCTARSLVCFMSMGIGSLALDFYNDYF